jgi:two-component system, OmpR family, KDP operon response regulator KdpE
MPERASHGKLLIVDDEPAVRWALHRTLRVMGFDISEAANGEQALALLRTVRFDAVLLDIAMPGMDGVRACREIRKLMPLVGILMVTVKDSEAEKIEALDAGADDYVTKPFNVRELAARIRATVRRSQTSQAFATAAIHIGEVELDPARRAVRKAGEGIHLTPKEFDLLHYLMSHAGLSLTHSRLLAAVWGPEYRDQVEYLRTFMRQLRKKLGDDAANPRYLLTDSHVGYRFTGEEELAAGRQPE